MFKDIEKELQDKGLRFYDKSVHRSMITKGPLMSAKKFLANMMKTYSDIYESFSEGKGTGRFVITTNDEDREVATHTRSAGDLYSLFSTYKRGVTFKRFRKILYELIDEKKVGTHTCPDIKKRVYFWNTFLESETTAGNPYHDDEYGMTMDIKNIGEYDGFENTGAIHPDDSFDIFHKDNQCSKCQSDLIVINPYAHKIINGKRVEIINYLNREFRNDLRHIIALQMHNGLLPENERMCESCYYFNYDIDDYDEYDENDDSVCESCGLLKEHCQCENVDNFMEILNRTTNQKNV